MLIPLSQQATTTPKVRAAIQASDGPASVLAERFRHDGADAYKWRHRDSVLDRSHTAHRLRTTLNSSTGTCRVAFAPKGHCFVSLDDLCWRWFGVSESGCPRALPGLDRCLRRHGVGTWRDLKVKDVRP